MEDNRVILLCELLTLFQQSKSRSFQEVSHSPATKALKFVIAPSNFLIVQIFESLSAKILTRDVQPAILIEYITSIARRNLVYVFCGRLRSIKTPSQTRYRKGVNVPDKKHREILCGKTCKMNRTERKAVTIPENKWSTLIGRRGSETFLGPRTVIFNSRLHGWGKAGFSAYGLSERAHIQFYYAVRNVDICIIKIMMHMYYTEYILFVIKE